MFPKRSLPKEFKRVEDIPDHYLVRKGSIPMEFDERDRLDEYLDPKKAALDHWFEPQEEFPTNLPWWKLEEEI